MLVGAVAGIATAVHTHSDGLAFLAGGAAGALLACLFGLSVIWLNTNQYATGLAVSLFGAGFSAFVGIEYTQETLGERARFAIPLLSSSALLRPCALPASPVGLRGRRALLGDRLVLVSLAERLGFARRRRVAGVGARPRISREAHSTGRRGGRGSALWFGGCLRFHRLHPPLGRGHDRRQRLDRPLAHHLRHVAAYARPLGRLSVWRRHHVAAPFAGARRGRAGAVFDGCFPTFRRSWCSP